MPKAPPPIYGEIKLAGHPPPEQSPKPERAFSALGGMSLRDWFAGQALAGLIASGEPDEFRVDMPDDGSCIAVRRLVASGPERAYRLADAMLAERNKGNPK